VIGAAIAVGALAPRIVLADDADVVDDKPAASSAVRSVEAGAFLSSALSPRNDSGRGFATVMVGWDQARAGSTYDAAAEAQLVGPVSLRAGEVYDGPGTIASPHFELRLDAARQATYGVDLAVAVGYVDAGFSNVPAAVAKLAIGRNIGTAYVLGNVVYEHGQGGELSGELRLAALHPVSRAAHVGIDSRLQIDLERDDDEPAGEAEWEWRSGLVASYAWNRLVFTGGGGVSALRFRSGGPTAVGPVITAGIGTVF
jgi:hypothetical protein